MGAMWDLVQRFRDLLKESSTRTLTKSTKFLFSLETKFYGLVVILVIEVLQVVVQFSDICLTKIM
jgi:hypothetical protein